MSMTGVDTRQQAVGRYGAFRLGSMQLAMPIANLREVVPCDTLHPLPSPLASVLGGIKLRDVVIPVLDLRRLLGHPAPPFEAPSVLIGLHEGHVIGLLCDAVIGIFDAATSALTPVHAKGDNAGLFSHTVVRGDTGDTVSLVSLAALADVPGVPFVSDPEPVRAPQERANPDDNHDADATYLAIVLLRCDRVPLALDAMVVHATLPDVVIEPSPLARAPCLGVIEHAGERIAAIDLMALLNLGSLPRDGALQAVVVNAEGGHAAFIISEVCDVVRVASADVAHVPAFALPHPQLLCGTLPSAALPPQAAARTSSAASQHLLINGAALQQDEGVKALASLTQSVNSTAITGETKSFTRTAHQGINQRSMLTYMLGGETATPIEQIEEILPYSPELAIFDTRDSLLGVLISRGRSIPVMCLSGLVGLPAPAISPAVSILVVRAEDERIGFAVPQLRTIDNTDWEPSLGQPAGVASGSLAALVNSRRLARVGHGADERMLRVLDLRAIARSLIDRVGVSLRP